MEVTDINKKYQWATDMFADECQQRIGIRPLQDDKLVLDAAVNFGAYIKSYKRLDQSTAWHVGMVQSMVRNKVETLSKRIIKEYGTHKEYLDRMQRRPGPSRSTYQRNSIRTGTETEELDPSSGCCDAGSKEEVSNS